MIERQELGKLGEKLAKQYLESKNYQIIDQNYKNYFGEIDLIAKEGNFFVFVEVKTRLKNTFGRPEESITRQKQKKLIRISGQYLLENKIDPENYRIDSIAIEVDEISHQAKIRHLKNAVSYF
jgi:putative endonuclease